MTGYKILSIRDRLYRIISEHSGKDLETIAKDSDRDFFLSPVEAKEYGVIDEILKSCAR